MPTAKASQVFFSPALEGLRGVGVAGILLFHLGVPWLAGGFLGVSSFFTLSGFLITSLMVAEHERSGRIDLGAFWARRLRRIAPAALVTLAGVIVFGLFVADATQLMRLRGDGLSALVYGVNWWLIATGSDYADMLGSPSPVRHFWSLAIEAQFYLLHPLLCVAAFSLFRRSRRALAVLTALLSIASWVWLGSLEASGAPTSRLYYGTDTRCGELFAGACLALLWPRRTPSAGWPRAAIATLGILGVAVTAFFWVTASVNSPSLYRGDLALYTVATLAILAAAVTSAGPVSTLLSFSAVRWLGRVSYGAYLYHWPLYLWLTPERTGLADWPLAALRLALTLGLAELSQRCLEEPIRRRRWIRDWRRWAVPPLAAAGVVAGLFAVTAGLADPWPEFVPSTDSGRPAAPAGSEDLRVMVVGDSVAAGIGTGLQRWSGGNAQVQVSNGTLNGCGIAREGDMQASENHPGARRCSGWRERWASSLDRFQPDVVVVLAGKWDLITRQMPGWEQPRTIGDPAYDRWLLGEFQSAVDVLSAGRTRVVWLTSPCLKPGASGPMGRFDPERTRLVNRIISGPLAESRRDHLAVIDVFAAVCPAGAFTNTLDGIDEFRPDGNHFSRAGADWVARWLGPQLVALAEAPSSP